ncbi:MAG: hypothetical protein Q7S12_01290 [bacterium]|nr:hypothetical protein [bacterium]
MKTGRFLVLFGIWYLLWQFVPGGVALVEAQARRPNHSAKSVPPVRQNYGRVAPRGVRPNAFVPNYHKHFTQNHYYGGRHYRYVVVGNYYHVYDDVGVFIRSSPIVIINQPELPQPQDYPQQDSVPLPKRWDRAPQAPPQAPAVTRRGIYVVGVGENTERAVRGVKAAYRRRGIPLVDSAETAEKEARVGFELGDPQAVISLEVVDLETKEIVGQVEASEHFKLTRDPLKNRDLEREAIYAAAEKAVSESRLQ